MGIICINLTTYTICDQNTTGLVSQFISIQNIKLHTFPFKVIHLEFNSLFPNLPAMLL